MTLAAALDRCDKRLWLRECAEINQRRDADGGERAGRTRSAKTD